MRPNPHQRHLLGINDFMAEAEAARARGKSLAMTSGSFDKCDAVELRQLRQAARYGDVLLVLVLNDFQAAGCRHAAAFRADRVAAVRWVDLVAVAVPPPEWFIEALLPDAWIWSGDPESDPGRAFVQRYDGRVIQLAQPTPQRELPLTG